jgi:hypothetical protein
MWVRLLKYDKKLKAPVGRIIKVTPTRAREMIENKKANEYTGGFPVKKMKTDFFKPNKD